MPGRRGSGSASFWGDVPGPGGAAVVRVDFALCAGKAGRRGFGRARGFCAGWPGRLGGAGAVEGEHVAERAEETGGGGVGGEELGGSGFGEQGFDLAAEVGAFVLEVDNEPGTGVGAP